MLNFEVIGNLGADAHVEVANGRNFVTFSVADSRRWTDENGVLHESTQWISCTLDGDGGRLLPHLTRGRLVYVSGFGSARAYSSPKTHRFEAGLNISVQRIELLGSKQDEVPSRLYDDEGHEYVVSKAFYIGQESVKQLGVKRGQNVSLFARDGRELSVNHQGWITEPTVEKSSENTDESASEDSNA